MLNLPPSNWHLCNCLVCNKTITQFQWQVNNGTCDDCPGLTVIAPQFWKVILYMAEQGDWEAKKAIEKYMHPEEGT